MRISDLQERQVLVLRHGCGIRLWLHVLLLLIAYGLWDLTMKVRLVRGLCAAEVRVNERGLIEE